MLPSTSPRSVMTTLGKTGSATADARHWDKYVLKVFEEHAEELSSLFNGD